MGDRRGKRGIIILAECEKQNGRSRKCGVKGDSQSLTQRLKVDAHFVNYGKDSSLYTLYIMVHT